MRAAFALMILCLVGSPSFADDKPPLAEKYLVEGKLADGEKALQDVLKANPKDAQAQFGLGVTQFLRAVEHLAQDLHRHGFAARARTLGLGPDLKLPDHPDPKLVRYEDVRAMIQRWIDDLAAAESTLAKIDDPNVKLPLHFGQIRLDIDGDGTAGDGEILLKIYASLNRQADQEITAEDAQAFVIGFDRGDVAWLRGYCHLLMAMSEAALAHDGKRLFAHCAHLAFAKVESPYAFLNEEPRRANGLPVNEILDAIAAIHLMNFPVSEPKRMTAALGHLNSVITLSRESWKGYLAETDDDHEWIPNPKQTGVIPNVKVTDEMVQGWMGFLNEAESILAGKKLVPFWRGKPGKGVNIRRVFTEPRPFDLVLWVQGTAAVPYLEEGPVTTGETWQRLQRLFGGEFIGFAFWFN